MLPSNSLLSAFLQNQDGSSPAAPTTTTTTSSSPTGSGHVPQQTTATAMGFSTVVPKRKKIPASQVAQELANMTIDESHGRIMKKFHDIQTQELPRLQSELKQQKLLLKNLSRGGGNYHHSMLAAAMDGSANDDLGTSTTPSFSKDNSKWVEQRLNCEARIEALRNQIRRQKHDKEQYLLKNSKYLFKYFEDKKDISVSAVAPPALPDSPHSTVAAQHHPHQHRNSLSTTANLGGSRQGGGATTTTAAMEGSSSSSNAKVNSFFRIATNGSTENAEQVSTRYNPYSDRYSNSRLLYSNYWKNVNQDLTNLQDYFIPSDICEKCCVGELIPQDDEGVLICNNRQCGHFTSYIIDNEKPSYKEPPNEVTYNPYIRLNHFKEILSQFLAKQTTKIPADVVEAIRKRIKKQRITDLSEINYQKMRQILKQLGLNKYFEHIQYINSIFGIHPPVMSEELQEILCILFIEIQEPWTIHCPVDRTNFFHCTYILYQLCVLLEQRQYLPFIPMMKDREIQLEQDVVWEKVCNTLDWEFIPTV